MDEKMIPSLTLEPDKEMTLPEKKEIEPVKAEDETLTPEEWKVVNDFAEKIDLTDATMILQYGSASQRKVSDFSGTALEKVRTKDLGEVGEMVTGLIGQLRDFDVDTEEKKGIFGLFRRTQNQVETLKARYNKVEANVEEIQTALEGRD